jgi:type II secretion system protein I
MSSTRTSRRASRTGLSLLEVILALAILAGALAVLGELVSMGTRSAATARDLTRAQILCESKLAELTLGTEPVVAQQQTEFQMDPEWVYSVAVESLGQTGLVSIRVAVQRESEGERDAAAYSLVRWLPDPNVQWPTEFVTDDGTAAGP